MHKCITTRIDSALPDLFTNKLLMVQKKLVQEEWHKEGDANAKGMLFAWDLGDEPHL
jgi:hypothetical protein